MKPPIEERLRNSVAWNAHNGSGFERAMCSRQMAEAADEIARLRVEAAKATAIKHELERLYSDRQRLISEVSKWKAFAGRNNGFSIAEMGLQ